MRGELDWIVMKALEKDRRRRYETANDFAADVMRHLADEPVEACPPSAWYRFAKFARRNRAALTTAALVGVGPGRWARRSAPGRRSGRRGPSGRRCGPRRPSRGERDRCVEGRRQGDSRGRRAARASIALAISDFLRDDLLAEAAPGEE